MYMYSGYNAALGHVLYVVTALVLLYKEWPQGYLWRLLTSLGVGTEKFTCRDSHLWRPDKEEVLIMILLSLGKIMIIMIIIATVHIIPMQTHCITHNIYIFIILRTQN